MKKQLLALTISSLFTINANAAVSGRPSGWVKSGDGKECVLTEKQALPLKSIIKKISFNN